MRTNLWELKLSRFLYKCDTPTMLFEKKNEIVFKIYYYDRWTFNSKASYKCYLTNLTECDAFDSKD